MAKKTPIKHASGRRGDPISLSPLTPDQAISGMFKIAPNDVERIIGKKSKARPKKK